MKKNKKMLIYSLVNFTSLTVYILSLGFGIFLVMNGMHSVDISYNMANLEARYDIELRDIATDYNWYEANDIYINGIRQVHKGLFLSCISSYGLGMYAIMTFRFFYD